MDLDRLYKNFDLLKEWEGRYRFLIDMGKKLPQLSEADKTEANRVYGCMSTVYMTVTPSSKRPGAIEFNANSDALIVNGLIAVLLIIYNEKTPEEIKAIDIKAIFSKLGLETHLSPNRRNGFFSMVERLQKESSSVVKS